VRKRLVFWRQGVNEVGEGLHSTVERRTVSRQRGAVRLDRWVLPPAVVAAVFTTVAIVPPVGPPSRALRVEAAGAHEPGRPWLLRLALEEAEDARWRAPHSVTVRLHEGQGVVRAEASPSVSGLPYWFGRVVPTAHGPSRLEVQAEGLHALVTLPRARPMETAPEVPLPARENAPIEVRVEGGALVPEVPGTVLVRVPDADEETEVQLEPSDASLRVPSPRARLDGCGVAAFEATVMGLDAHAVVHVLGPRARVTRRRLPVVPGGLSVRANEDALAVTAPVGGAPVFALAGDARGATYWSAARLDAPSDDNAHARIVLPREATWALVSHSPAFEGAAGLWLRDPPGASCTRTPLGARFARTATRVPVPPTVTLVHDGAALARQAHAVLRQRVRVVALSLAMAAIALLITLVLAAGLQRDPTALRRFAHSPRQRMGLALGGAGALLVGGLVLWLTFLLRR
jgi:hypothetical protein